jgi:hypothetical protein
MQSWTPATLILSAGTVGRSIRQVDMQSRIPIRKSICDASECIASSCRHGQIRLLITSTAMAWTTAGPTCGSVPKPRTAATVVNRAAGLRGTRVCHSPRGGRSRGGHRSGSVRKFDAWAISPARMKLAKPMTKPLRHASAHSRGSISLIERMWSPSHFIANSSMIFSRSLSSRNPISFLHSRSPICLEPNKKTSLTRTDSISFADARCAYWISYWIRP